MLCKSCKQKIREGMKFCPYCGINIDIDVQKQPFASKTEIDKAIKSRNFALIWNEISKNNNVYAEYAYEQYFHQRIKRVSNEDDFNKATKQIVNYVKEGYIYAAYLYGNALMWSYDERNLLEGRDYLAGPEQVAKGKQILLSLAEKRLTSAQATVGKWYKYGYWGFLKNKIAAFEMLNSAANKLHPDAMYELAISYQNGDMGLQKNPQKSEKYMERAAYFGGSRAVREIKKRIIESEEQQKYISAIIERYEPLLQKKGE